MNPTTKKEGMCERCGEILEPRSNSTGPCPSSTNLHGIERWACKNGHVSGAMTCKGQYPSCQPKPEVCGVCNKEKCYGNLVDGPLHTCPNPAFCHGHSPEPKGEGWTLSNKENEDLSRICLKIEKKGWLSPDIFRMMTDFFYPLIRTKKAEWESAARRDALVEAERAVQKGIYEAAQCVECFEGEPSCSKHNALSAITALLNRE